MSSFNNFCGADFGHSAPENNEFNYYGYPVEATSEPFTHAAQASGLKFNPTAAGTSTAETGNWWLEHQLDDNTDQYAGSTALTSCNEFAREGYKFQAGSTFGGSSFNTGESRRHLLSVVNAAFNTDNICRLRSRF